MPNEVLIRSAFCFVPPFTLAGRTSALPVILRVDAKILRVFCLCNSRPNNRTIKRKFRAIIGNIEQSFFAANICRGGCARCRLQQPTRRQQQVPGLSECILSILPLYIYNEKAAVLLYLAYSFMTSKQGHALLTFGKSRCPQINAFGKVAWSSAMSLSRDLRWAAFRVSAGAPSTSRPPT